MDILLAQIILCGLFGLVTGLVASFVLLERENTVVSIICSLFGLTTGIWVSIAWIFFTGGTVLNAIMVFVVVLTTLVVLMLVLSQIKEIARMFRYKTSRNTTVFAFAGLVALSFLLMISTIPMHASNPSPVSIYGTNIYMYDSTSLKVDSNLANEINSFTQTSYQGIPMDVDVKQASLNFPFFTANPEPGQYLNFDITFNVGTSGGAWSSPYVKIGVFHDTDGNGAISDNDDVWSPYLIKAVTSSGKWRSQLYYESNQPGGQLTAIGTSSGIIFMPIFHANEITIWKNDNGIKFPENTPSGYTSPHDQMSWDLVGNELTLKEQINSFAVVSKGSSVTFKGQLYCHESFQGNNILWVGAYDLAFQDNPFETGFGSPLNSKTHTFTIAGGSQPGSPTVNAGGPYSGNVGQNIQFSGTATGGTTPYTQWKWTFSDGDTKTGQSVSKSFSTAGSHSASLTVTDSAGKTGTGTATVTISDGGGQIPPTVNAGGPYSGTIGQNIQFSGTASGGTTPYVEWKWTFSDGTTKIGQSVSKSFSTAGSHSATLSVKDSAGLTGTKSASVTITDSILPPDVDIDISTYIAVASLSLGCIGAVVYGKKYL